MSKNIIYQLWSDYQETKDKRLLIDAVRYADFDGNQSIKDEIIKLLRDAVGKRSDHGLKIRNRDISKLHSDNLNSGMNITASYNQVAEVFSMSVDAVRKVIEKSEEKPD